MKQLLFVFTLSFSCCLLAQNLVQQPACLDELSGLEFINDSTLVAHNDGGDKPQLYFLNLKGELLHTLRIEGAKNVDWEDLAYDGKQYLYIGDFGNNDNKRQDLRIYKVDMRNALQVESLPATAIDFYYPDQETFPAVDSLKFYDCEGMIYYQDSLYLFNKTRCKPWNGNAKVYSLAIDKTQQAATPRGELYIGPAGWWQDAVTAATSNGKYCYILTYNRVMIYKIKKDKLNFVKSKKLKPVTQKEAIAVNNCGLMVIGDERSKLLRGGELRIEKWGK